MAQRQPYDLDAYVERTRSGPCFICEFLAGNPDYPHHAVYEDEHAVAFLAQAPNRQGRTLVQTPGYTLVVPRAHHTQLAEDLSVDGHLHLQRVVYRVAQALRRVLPTERVYVLSLGSNDGNSHVHWHVVPLPPGVPYGEQQFHFLMAENGVHDIGPERQAEIAALLRAKLNEMAASGADRTDQ